MGALLCVAVMFVSAWYFALISIFIGAGVYKYIEYAGAEKEWGDGLKGIKIKVLFGYVPTIFFVFLIVFRVFKFGNTILILVFVILSVIFRHHIQVSKILTLC